MRISLYKKYKLLNGCDQKETSIEYKQVIGWLSVLLFTILILMDYEVFIDVFHFSKASFLSIYFYNLNPLNSEFFILFAMMPLILIITVFLIPYFSVNIPIQNSELIEKNYIIKERQKADIPIVLFFSFFYTACLFLINVGIYYLLVNFINLPTEFIFQFAIIFISVFISLYFSYIYTYYILKQLVTDITITSSDILASFIGVTFLYALLIYITKLYVLYNLIVLFEMMISFLFIDFSFQKKLNMFNKIDKKIFIIIFVFSLFLVILNNLNMDTWKKLNDLNTVPPKEEQEVRFTFNLLLNKTFLSPNKNHILVNCMNDENMSLNEITTVLPLSNTVKLYFKRKNENFAYVYAVEKKYFHGKPVYNLLDTGYIDNNETKN